MSQCGAACFCLLILCFVVLDVVTHSEMHITLLQGSNKGCMSTDRNAVSLLNRARMTFLTGFYCPPQGLRLLGATVRRGELMFSSAPRENNAHRHMKTSDFAGPKSAARSRQKTTSRTWGPIGGERLKRDPCFVNFLTTKRWAGVVFTRRLAVCGGWGAAEQAILHVGSVVFVEVVACVLHVYPASK